MATSWSASIDDPLPVQPMTAPEDLIRRVEEAWRAFRDTLPLEDLERQTPSGWSVKEMVAHIAFWMETVPPFVTGAFRGDTSAFQTTFPSGYDAGGGDWPEAAVHNAREAAWARTQPGDAVIARADEAFAGLRSFLATVRDDELAAHDEYFREVDGHLRQHLAEDLTR